MLHRIAEPGPWRPLANCWLLAALSSLAEKDGWIESLFAQREASARGKYQVYLHDVRRRKMSITVDDRVPCSAAGEPIFSAAAGDEAWVPLLEKAFAKLCGSYAALEGGDALWA